METIVWDLDKMNRLAITVENLLRQGCNHSQTFEFDGQNFVLGYAVYLLEYLEERIVK